MNILVKLIFTVPLFIGITIELVSMNSSVMRTIIFTYSIMYLVVEIYKLSFGKKKIESSRGVAKFLFGENSAFTQSGVFFKESILNTKGKKRVLPFFVLLLSLGYCILYLIYMFIT
jgi:hypothetical protein